VARILAPDARITVLDPSPSELAARPAGLAAIQGFLEDPILTGELFDRILLCETVDHLTEPAAALRNLWNVTVPDGIMYVDYVVSTSFKIDHPNYFEEGSICTLLTNSGWRLEDRHSGQSHVGFLCLKS